MDAVKAEGRRGSAGHGIGLSVCRHRGVGGSPASPRCLGSGRTVSPRWAPCLPWPPAHPLPAAPGGIAPLSWRGRRGRSQPHLLVRAAATLVQETERRNIFHLARLLTLGFVGLGFCNKGRHAAIPRESVLFTKKVKR